jgi:hypothetical protein
MVRLPSTIDSMIRPFLACATCLYRPGYVAIDNIPFKFIVFSVFIVGLIIAAAKLQSLWRFEKFFCTADAKIRQKIYVNGF